MATESAFLNLPRELRDEIYRIWASFEDGLVYNFDYGQKEKPKRHNVLEDLAPANKKERIDLALRSTCKQVHTETEGLILRFNTITFSSTHISRSNSDEVRVRAARFHFLRVPLTMEAASFLYYEDDTVVRPCYTSTVVDEVVRTHPSIGPLLRTLLAKDTHWAEIGSAHRLLQARPHDHCPDPGPGPTESWGIVPSSMRRALMHALKVTADHGCFSGGPAAQRPTCPPREMLALDAEFPAWSIPTDADLLKLSRPYAWKTTDFCENTYCHSSRQLHTTEFWNGSRYHEWVPPESLELGPRLGVEETTESDNRGKYRFSAASVAIKFLSSLPGNMRLHLRHLRLLENNVCVAFPESHAQGLISFCVENPNLRVERRVSMWKAIFQQQTRHNDTWNTVNGLEVPEQQHLISKLCDDTGFPTSSITDNLALWVMEAAALVPAGMPEKSFTLVLDGAPGDDILLDVFMNYVQRDAAWQRAWEIASERATGKPETGEQETDDHFMRLRGPRCYLYEGFPSVIEDIANNRSKVIQCTFNPGPQLWDAEAELDKYQPNSAETWDKLRNEHRGMFYWRPLERQELFADLVYKRQVLPYESGDEYFSD